MTPLARRLFDLWFLKGVGPKTLQKLAAHDYLAELAADELSRLDKKLSKALAEPDALGSAETTAARQLQLAEQHGARVLCSMDEDFPKLLAATDDSPMFLFVAGDRRALHDRSLAVIGTREPSEHGVVITERVTSYFAGEGWSVVSGLALGCDATAHEAALAARGQTVAVLAHGLQTVAPKQHEALARDIVESGGALVTEYPFGTEPAPHQFVARDRIQAGLSRGVVMIQSDLNGGALHAARAAMRYGRIVAVPAPTSADAAANHTKVAANRVLIEGTPDERAKLLACDLDALPRVMPVRSKDDYAELMARLEAVPVG